MTSESVGLSSIESFSKTCIRAIIDRTFYFQGFECKFLSDKVRNHAEKIINEESEKVFVMLRNVGFVVNCFKEKNKE